MTPFNYSEPEFYLFGLKAGLASAMKNRLALGGKKTIGKITQPVNFYSRFPEYHYFLAALEPFIRGNNGIPKILDVGSPKLFGLYLAFTQKVELTMTDISSLNIDEYRIMWRGLSDRAKGSVHFELQDIRGLSYDSGLFDAVFSMSVLEHVEGDGKDSEAVGEMLRVLRPGGLLVFSVPVGERHQDQLRPTTGFDHQGAARAQDEFFQRVYSRATAEKMLLTPLSGEAVVQSYVTVARKPTSLLKKYLKLGQGLRGFLGFLNPFLSVSYNRTLTDVSDPIPSEYGFRHSGADIYGDIICSSIKKAAEASRCL
ncbi:MAG: class I SAM-dependent methyltransferase [Thermoleophilia bacterium]